MLFDHHSKPVRRKGRYKAIGYTIETVQVPSLEQAMLARLRSQNNKTIATLTWLLGHVVSENDRLLDHPTNALLQTEPAFEEKLPAIGKRKCQSKQEMLDTLNFLVNLYADAKSQTTRLHAFEGIVAVARNQISEIVSEIEAEELIRIYLDETLQFGISVSESLPTEPKEGYR